MKAYKKFSLTAVILSALLVLSSVSAIASNDTVEEEMAQGGAGVYTDSQKESTTKQVEQFDGEQAEYAQTVNQSGTPLADRTDIYGTYDVYTDADGNEYIYLFDTDTLCGYKWAAAYTDQLDEEAVLPQETARANADAFLDGQFGQNQAIYQFERSYYSEVNGVYVCEYAYYLNGVKTDDSCVIWVRADSGQVCAFNTFKYGRYTSLTDLTVDTASTRAQLNAALWDKGVSPLNRAASYEITDEYLTKTDDGAIVMQYEVLLSGAGAAEEYQIPVVEAIG